MWYENRGGDLQGCLFPDITLILAAFIFIWLHCLTSRSPGSPQKAGSGAPVIPDVADTDMWNNMDGEDPSSHSYSSPHVTAAVCHFLLMCSDYETTHVVSMISVCVCVCCSVWKKMQGICKRACVSVPFNRWLTKTTHLSRDTRNCNPVCVWHHVLLQASRLRVCAAWWRWEERFLFTVCIFIVVEQLALSPQSRTAPGAGPSMVGGYMLGALRCKDMHGWLISDS